MNYTDIILNQTTYDLNISSNGDFEVLNSDEQSASLLIQFAEGNLKQYPLVGVGIVNYLASNSSQDYISQIIRAQLVQDGFNVETLSVAPNGTIKLTATR